ncbi:MAG: MarR family transcriptional regulator [Desulfurococcales archaeon]|nr:MarR family transcriptional regulator [Desulfurococcales archaeon]MEB3788494.1 MarR family transcriptional regulator [Desulfurococcales archaeon]
MPKHQLSELEKKALELIKSRDGILQSELWKTLGLDSREGSRLVLRLVKKGLVKREQVSVNGRRTYRLFTIEDRAKKVSLLIDMSTAIRIPCTTCPFFDECGPRNFHDPSTCILLEIWLQREVERRRQIQDTYTRPQLKIKQ